MKWKISWNVLLIDEFQRMHFRFRLLMLLLNTIYWSHLHPLSLLHKSNCKSCHSCEGASKCHCNLNLPLDGFTPCCDKKLKGMFSLQGKNVFHRTNKWETLQQNFSICVLHKNKFLMKHLKIIRWNIDRFDGWPTSLNEISLSLHVTSG